MEESDLMKRKTKLAVFLVRIAAVMGSLMLLFMPSIYKNPFNVYLILWSIMILPIGLLTAYILGLIVRFIFKSFVKNKLAYRITLAVSILISYLLGALVFMLVTRGYIVIREKPYTNQIDTNRDGKIDKWIHHNGTSTISEIDTDYDGKPNIRKYYNNGDLVKVENISI